jgi:hypothetical protein
MRLSAGSIKGNHQLKQSKPREGSKLRGYYDRLVQGEAINFPGLKETNRKGIIRQLRDYDLEIITIRDPASTSRTRPTVLYKCIGIWAGDTLQSIEDVEVALDNTLNKES